MIEERDGFNYAPDEESALAKLIQRVERELTEDHYGDFRTDYAASWFREHRTELLEALGLRFAPLEINGANQAAWFE